MIGNQWKAMSTLSLHAFPRPYLFERALRNDSQVTCLLKPSRMAKQAHFSFAKLCQAVAHVAGRLLTDSVIPTSVDNISPRKVLEDGGKQVPCFTNKETGARRTLAQVHMQVTNVGKNADLHVVNPELCVSLLGTWPLIYRGLLGDSLGLLP